MINKKFNFLFPEKNLFLNIIKKFEFLNFRNLYHTILIGHYPKKSLLVVEISLEKIS